MLKYIDSHAHYDDSAFDGDRDVLLPQLHENGVMNIITIGCSERSSKAAAALAEKYDFMYFAPGIHPEEANTVGDGYKELIVSLCGHRKAVAVGEIGLDYHYEGYDKARQKELFETQLEIARRLDKPVIIHMRDATADTMEILRKYRPRGVVHCFSGSAETAEEVIGLGMYIGFTGALTFKNARKAIESAERIPLDRILVETDCPYMAPEPFRGKRCDSSMIAYTLTKLAEIKGITPEQAAEATAENTRRLFSGMTHS